MDYHAGDNVHNAAEEYDESDEMESGAEVVAVMGAAAPAADDYDDDDAAESVAVNEDEVAEVQAGNDEEEDDDVVLAAVVVDDAGNEEEDDGSVSVAEPVVVAAEPAAAANKRKRPGSTPRKSAAGVANAIAAAKSGGIEMKKAPDQNNLNPPEYDLSGVDPVRVSAGRDARALLVGTVTSLPSNLGDAQVRALGQLQAPPSEGSDNDSHDLHNPFATHNALYAVGFSCDRFDFSPTHGRMMKLRCSILDGRRILQQRSEHNLVPTNGEPELHEGPVFRVMWGRGIDEDDMDEYQYEPFVHSNFDAGDGVDAAAKRAVPVEDMRVKTRFDQNEHYMGTIFKVNRLPDGKNKKKEMFSIGIRYDDGTIETTEFPDPDITLFFPGTDPDMGTDGRVELDQLNGRPVNSVIGLSPIQAWGRALCKLGLVDEVMHDAGIHALDQLHAGVLERSGKGDAKQGANDASNGGGLGGGVDYDDPQRDPPSEKEKYLRNEIDNLLEELKEASEEDRQAQTDLSDIRISQEGPFLGNPFSHTETPKSQQMTWLSVAIRRERNRMGSNKRKVLTSVDILDKSDTFYNPEINALMEGLPGTEHCSSYVFRSHRGKAGHKAAQNRAAQEAKKRQEQEQEAKKQSKVPARPVQKTTEQQDRDRKRKEREDERDEKKRQKMEEEDQRKQARINERMARLRLQVDDRLYKEVASQREKVVAAMARALVKEFTRRRKAAEALAGQRVIETKRKSKVVRITNPTPGLPLPTMSSKVYNEDVVRLWDFVSTFGDFFLSRKILPEIPSLDSLQSAVDCLKGEDVKGMKKEDAVAALTGLAIALCDPMTTTLTRILFASLIALNPMLQKEYGAVFFADMSSPEPLKEEDIIKLDVLLPVNQVTWQEVARLAFISDALGELGLQRHEVAHILRGYRSAGHPNSKEAQRLRKVEGHTIATIKQAVVEGKLSQIKPPSVNQMRIDVPCHPVCDSTSHWFYLHAFISLDENAVAAMRTNLTKAIDMVASDPEMRSLHEDMSAVRETLAQVHDAAQPSKADLKFVRKARRMLVTSFEKHGGNKLSAKECYMADGKWSWHADTNKEGISRQRIGLLKSLDLNKEEYKILSAKRTEYMEEALRLKEEMEREKRKGDGADAGDDDDDDEDDGEQKVEVVGEGETGAKPSTAEVKKIGKETPHDEFCADVPRAPEPIRRCLAVLRALASVGSAEPFIYPVDPQTNPGYYESVLRPMCLREAGRLLLLTANNEPSNEAVEKAVCEFGRNVRLVARNCRAYSNAGPNVIAAGAELMKIFERLLFDWVLAPPHHLPHLEALDDDKCVDHHDSDEQNTVLLCDRCEGKYNIKRLDPPLKEIPKGDWYCPRCVSGRWWGSLDPRIGKQVSRASDGSAGTIVRCFFRCTDKDTPSLLYEVRFKSSSSEYWSLETTDKALSDAGISVEPIRCLEAVAESPGYREGVDEGMRIGHLVPVPLDPYTSETAARACTASSVFRESLLASASLLLIDPCDMTWEEWLRLLILLLMKCSACDMMQNVIAKMESTAAEKMGPKVEALSKSNDIRAILSDTIDTLPLKLEEKTAAAATKNAGKGSAAPSASKKSSPAVVVDAGAVEVVEEVDASAVEVAASTPTPLPEGATAVASATAMPEPSRDPLMEALEEKAHRHKVVEELFAGQTIKNQIRTTIATFEEDGVSAVVDSSLSGESIGLDFRGVACRGMVCFFCGLSDQALGSPLVRVPDADEWNELIPYSVAKQRTHLVAEDLRRKDEGKTKLISLRIKLDGELVSEDDSDLEKSGDGGIMEFVPRADRAFQNELQFRYDNGLSFMTGSLSAHECCAVAAHNSRKDRMLQEFREKQAELIEQEAGLACGRTLQIGRDQNGRAYWKFKADPDALFVSQISGEGILQWFRFPDAESISGVLFSLGKDPVARNLRRLHPTAAGYVRDGSWSRRILERQFPNIAEMVAISSKDEDPQSSDRGSHKVQVEGGYDAFEEGEEVLVEAKSKEFLWDATILEVSRKGRKEPIEAYKVQYTSWSSRFVEWVHPSRISEPSEHNRSLQAEMLDEVASTRCGLPVDLNFLKAKDFLVAGDRARGSTPLPDFTQIAWTDETQPAGDKFINQLKTALLAIEAALPVGSIQNTDTGVWRNSFACEWRQMVCACEGPANLMRLVIFFEDNISTEWFREDVQTIRSCLPNRWKAVEESSASGVAIRIFLLDLSLKYDTFDRKRYAKRKRKH